ncbi:hypothetical protein WICANDRAFT_80102 [Wickerhamomyces anomalus NRRL Y-366-8]|uniref:Uncharacterized protein n=1 Tax=Wickerhamomyces anomalus (strain ATCC 58044 / CBS 1984 / NCYC 433 / NRRL Y-366-8) TaxID=683960 RepID=A0A1E3NXQ4_WICAA|nr:uncharacterized protein WICANDRAFT_80102 [Wickerhamomyces anomalus NRRL Y-366-8]ODQ57938.1 hypothetical protein WICANDRAFT_80102 [Wickerhamomyces anomalus NRRL Y-366-8]
MVDGSVVSADSEVSDDSLEVSYDSSISESSELVIGVSARAIASEPYTNSVVLIVTTIDGKKLVKRAVLVFDLSATIRENASSISSGATGGSGSSTMETSGESSTGAISVTSGSTTSGFVSGTETASSVASTSTSTVSTMSTTVVAVTSCSSHSCTEVSITTGVTVVTSTVEGTVTTFTTFCPLSSTSGSSIATTEPTSVTGSKPEGTLTSVVHASSTTVITVTSCSEQKCTKIPTTTGVTVVTSTDAGTETVYTTYCPLSSTVILGQTSTTVGAVVPPASEGPAISGTAGNVGNNPGSQAAPTVATNEAGSVRTAHSAAIATSENASQGADLYPIGSVATSVGPQAQATAVSGNEDTTSTVVIQVTKTEASAIETMSTSNMPYSIPPSSSYEAAASKNVFSSFTGLLVFLLMLF